MQNRRSDKRLLPPDLQVRVRRSGRKDSSLFVDCMHIDISINGLAFYSSELQLEISQKIDLQIFLGRRMFEGSAVVCDMESSANRCRYGVLFIDLKPSLEEVFGIKSLFSSQIREVAVSMADNALINRKSNEQERNLKRAQLFLFDGVEAFKTRICDRLTDVTDLPHKADELANLFQFNSDNGSVTVPLLGDDGISVVHCEISAQADSASQQIVFVADNGRKFSTLMEFLQELSDTFTLLLSDDP